MMPTALPTWATKPETIFAVVLFILGIVVSLFAGDIRRGMGRSVERSGNFLNQWRTNYYSNELRTLERVHGNPYELLLYLASQFVGATVGILRLSVVYLIMASVGILAKWTSSKELFVLNPISLAGGALIGRAVPVFQTLNRLYDYENKRRELQEKVERLSK
jgi:hypothetical protein